MEKKERKTNRKTEKKNCIKKRKIEMMIIEEENYKRKDNM